VFFSPAARGAEVGKRLIEGVAAVGRAQGWSVIRWLKAEDNYRARSSYDKIATRTRWAVYDIAL
jgi:GNAT superfamily N-acetyltransferase